MGDNEFVLSVTTKLPVEIVVGLKTPINDKSPPTETLPELDKVSISIPPMTFEPFEKVANLVTVKAPPKFVSNPTPKPPTMTAAPFVEAVEFLMSFTIKSLVEIVVGL